VVRLSILRSVKVYVGADHRGYELKEHLKGWLEEEGYDVEDCGAYGFDPEDDYPSYAEDVARLVGADADSRGILLCGSGHGVDIVANRFSAVRSIVGFNADVIVQGREHENANVLSIPADWVTKKLAVEMVGDFLRTPFSEQARHKRRIEELGKWGS